MRVRCATTVLLLMPDGSIPTGRVLGAMSDPPLKSPRKLPASRSTRRRSDASHRAATRGDTAHRRRSLVLGRTQPATRWTRVSWACGRYQLHRGGHGDRCQTPEARCPCGPRCLVRGGTDHEPVHLVDGLAWDRLRTASSGGSTPGVETPALGSDQRPSRSTPNLRRGRVLDARSRWRRQQRSRRQEPRRERRCAQRSPGSAPRRLRHRVRASGRTRGGQCTTRRRGEQPPARRIARGCRDPAAETPVCLRELRCAWADSNRRHPL